VGGLPSPDITKPPSPLEDQLRELRVALAGKVPRKRPDQNLLIGTWNVRAFGDMNDKWLSTAGDSPQRAAFDVACIAEIVSCFDIVAIQEVRANLRSLRYMLKALGRNWGVLMTDVTKGKDGNNERMAFVYDTSRVRPSGLACELVEPVDATGVATGAFNRQFARTPYAVSFATTTTTVILTTLHVVYGSDLTDRGDELQAIAEWLSDWAEQEEEWRHNLIAIGDFNIDRRGDELFDAFTSTGLTPAPSLNEVPRTIFDTPKRQSFYDQIAWFADAHKGPLLTLDCSDAGSFDFVPNLQGKRTKTELSWHLSDHYPMYVEFALPPKPR
jgi:endonuclease/exonuclease/phosphatase family metal-dependent hydrolase